MWAEHPLHLHKCEFELTPIPEKIEEKPARSLCEETKNRVIPLSQEVTPENIEELFKQIYSITQNAVDRKKAYQFLDKNLSVAINCLWSKIDSFLERASDMSHYEVFLWNNKTQALRHLWNAVGWNLNDGKYQRRAEEVFNYWKTPSQWVNWGWDKSFLMLYLKEWRNNIFQSYFMYVLAHINEQLSNTWDKRIYLDKTWIDLKTDLRRLKQVLSMQKHRWAFVSLKNIQATQRLIDFYKEANNLNK